MKKTYIPFLLPGISFVCAVILVTTSIIGIVKSHAQPMPIGTQFTGTITNGALIESVSNGLIVGESPLLPPTPPLVTTNGVVLPDSFIDALATATGIPAALVKVLPLKAIVWLFALATGLPLLAQYARKFLPNSVQTGTLGTILKHSALEMNPGQNPTPEGVPAKVKLEVAATGQEVKPVTLTEPQPSTK